MPQSIDLQEHPRSLEHLLELHGVEKRDDGSLNWIEGSKQHPRNWSLGRKLYDTSLLIFVEFFTLDLPWLMLLIRTC